MRLYLDILRIMVAIEQFTFLYVDRLLQRRKEKPFVMDNVIRVSVEKNS
jgi:hypothetical protein